VARFVLITISDFDPDQIEAAAISSRFVMFGSRHFGRTAGEAQIVFPRFSKPVILGPGMQLLGPFFGPPRCCPYLSPCVLIRIQQCPSFPTGRSGIISDCVRCRTDALPTQEYRLGLPVLSCVSHGTGPNGSDNARRHCPPALLPLRSQDLAHSH